MDAYGFYNAMLGGTQPGGGGDGAPSPSSSCFELEEQAGDQCLVKNCVLAVGGSAVECADAQTEFANGSYVCAIVDFTADGATLSVAGKAPSELKSTITQFMRPLYYKKDTGDIVDMRWGPQVIALC